MKSVYVCVCICGVIYTDMLCLCVRVHMYVHLWVHVWGYVCVCVSACVHAHIHAHARIHVMSDYKVGCTSSIYTFFEAWSFLVNHYISQPSWLAQELLETTTYYYLLLLFWNAVITSTPYFAWLYKISGDQNSFCGCMSGALLTEPCPQLCRKFECTLSVSMLNLLLIILVLS